MLNLHQRELFDMNQLETLKKEFTWLENNNKVEKNFYLVTVTTWKYNYKSLVFDKPLNSSGNFVPQTTPTMLNLPTNKFMVDL
ncbi:hypothetical protein RIR_jg38645.t1 [Rhizophagus irregularis DAOM 181602=DAOM 197198]|nr:hypothetical protein RIR_jg38645.t1 [Rhizophagus irregularis DAOM 181602=DAOM 197198]